MKLWVAVLLLGLCAAGMILGARYLKGRPAIRRFVILACGVFGAMLALYSLLAAFLLNFAAPDPQPEDPTPAQTEPAASQTILYLSLDGLEYKNGAFFLTVTTMTEDLTVVDSRCLPLHESVAASMLPGWDEYGRRYDFYTAKDFSQYWKYSEEQGFPVTGSICRFQRDADTITELTELDPTAENLMD